MRSLERAQPAPVLTPSQNQARYWELLESRMRRQLAATARMALHDSTWGCLNSISSQPKPTTRKQLLGWNLISTTSFQSGYNISNEKVSRNCSRLIDDAQLSWKGRVRLQRSTCQLPSKLPANCRPPSSTITETHILVIVVDADGQSLRPIYYWQNLFVFDFQIKTKSKRLKHHLATNTKKTYSKRSNEKVPEQVGFSSTCAQYLHDIPPPELLFT
jgi:hypothetical protein